jgi:hypothetical protein
MTAELLIEEGRKLQRSCAFLTPERNGEVAAVWHERDEDEILATGERCWLTVNARHIPGLSPMLTGHLSIFSDEYDCESGRVEVAPSRPKRAGTELFAHPASVLPPIDAVFARGSEAIGDWIRSHGWRRTDRYNDNFKDAAIVREYERVWHREFPIYFESNIHAVLGGWHFPMADRDWHELLDEQLMVFTLRDSEPWVEAWRMRTGLFRVIQRIT